MWCRVCAQDVPGVPSLEEGTYSCARCSAPLIPFAPHAAPSQPAPHGKGNHAGGVERKATSAVRRAPGYDGWEIEEQLRHAFRVLRSTRTGTNQEAPADGPKFRVDAGHRVPAPHAKKARRASRRIDRPAAAKRRQTPASGGGLLAALVWLALSLGTMAFGCGLALLGWSAYAHSQELWTIGAPIILGGQIALVLGLVLQLERIWRDSRRAAARLEVVDEQIDDLKTATSLLSTTHAPSNAFYSHWAGGAGSEMLLSDLKSQLDLLAVKLSQE
jgi:hypothetical protein